MAYLDEMNIGGIDYDLQDKRTPDNIVGDLAKIGFGTAACDTAAATAAKTVTVSNFILMKNGIVTVRFTNGNTAASATLNVSGSGAKPIYLNGQPVQPGDIRAGMKVMLQYNGTQWDIASLLGLEPGGSASDLYVDMGLPSGLLWAKKNIDATQANGFAASEYQYEASFFSFGNVDPHNPISTSAFDYDFGSTNDGPYASTPGATITYPGSAGPSHDAARAICGAPWREPDMENYAELFNSSYTKFIDADGNDIAAETTDKRITMNSIVGIRLRSKVNGNILFFPGSGSGSGTSWNYHGSYGVYWSRSLYSAANGRYLNFNSGGVSPQNNSRRFNGFPVRPVQ